jgi:hypothetical protein
MITPKDLQIVATTYLDLSNQYTAILEPMSESELNIVPYSGSWTAAQVIQHIGKANHSGFLSVPGDQADRDIGELIPMLEKEFLNFNTKMSSPDFLVPESRGFSKHETMQLIQSVFQSLAEKLPGSDLTLILDTPLGRITKWELANFIVFHSKRHLYQLEKIHKALQ